MKFWKLFLLIAAGFCLFACGSQNMNDDMSALDVQGHRGCRGLLPENTVPAFLKAIDLGVSTLEMDLVITGDNQVLVSHEPFFNYEISTAPDGHLITEDEQLSHNIFKMDYDSVRQYDVGLRDHPRFPNQKKMAAHKPLFKDLITEVVQYCNEQGKDVPFFNVEIKRVDGFDGVFHPDASTFARLVLEAIASSPIPEKIYIQSFDVQSLEEAKRQNSDIKLVYLIENNDGIETNLDRLSFTPNVYSPDFNLIDEDAVKVCREKGIDLIPWTVNEESDMQTLIDLPVDGIITDYPDVLINYCNKNSIQIL